MPKKRVYTPEEKKLVRRLLLIHGGDIAIVHQLTSIPERTLRHWRNRWDDDYQLFSNALAGNSLLPAMANPAPKQPAIPKAARDTPFAEPNDSLAEYTHLRQKLMEHTTTLANDLLHGDGPVHQRVQALSRLLDRILALDEILPATPTPEQSIDPSEQSQQTIRFEYYYDDAVQKLPPWYGASTEQGPIRSRENYLPESHPAYRPPRSITPIDDQDHPFQRERRDYTIEDLTRGLSDHYPESPRDPEADPNQQPEDDPS